MFGLQGLAWIAEARARWSRAWRLWRRSSIYSIFLPGQVITISSGKCS